MISLISVHLIVCTKMFWLARGPIYLKEIFLNSSTRVQLFRNIKPLSDISTCFKSENLSEWPHTSMTWLVICSNIYHSYLSQLGAPKIKSTSLQRSCYYS